MRRRRSSFFFLIVCVCEMNNKKNKKEEEKKKEGRKEGRGRWKKVVCVLKTYTVLLLLLYTHFHNDGISMLLSLSALPYNK